MKELIEIQSELKAPKDQFNDFGKYPYRSCEDILEALKPLLKKYKCQLTLSDDVINIGAHNYIKSTATFTNNENSLETVSALAREAESKKGMDASQISGSTSSYARKYALNGMFLIDDTKDSDATNKGKDVPIKGNTPAPKRQPQQRQTLSNNKNKVPCPNRDGQEVAEVYCANTCTSRQRCSVFDTHPDGTSRSSESDVAEDD